MHNSTPQIIVVGLGNLPLPGTRHSLGQLVIDALSDRLGIRMSSDRKGVIGRDIITIGETNVQLTLYKSKAAMNISGPSIADAFRNSIKQGNTNSLIVLQDSMDHDSEVLSSRLGGSANGHNGIKSIISALGGKDFYRFRLGIGDRGGADAASYVLGRLTSHEKQYWKEEGLDEVLNEIEKVALKGC
ncbi:peptidyl-trna hydrolase [Moniliophthora roreri MCA 2997]|uniref:peptidyl-tRNA hydrolase n=2 Tax=Moniliophthora roreri TaxID=221103 RepID=V2XUE4_MONRO|nr:peptidyl-trna hydrolase [Moniliophthora roreri MCA 2997]